MEDRGVSDEDKLTDKGKAAEAVAAVFASSLLRGKILFHKLDLERKTRTDEDIRDAVEEWLGDPAAAERQYGHIKDWDVSRVTDMSYLFHGIYGFNEDLSRWQTENVTDMSWMFCNALGFNCDLSRWQTGSVTTMEGMFYGAESFTGDLNQWKTDKVTNMSDIFHNAPTLLFKRCPDWYRQT